MKSLKTVVDEWLGSLTEEEFREMFGPDVDTDSNGMELIAHRKLKTDSIYGIYAKGIPDKPAPTITFGPRGNDSHWAVNGRPTMDSVAGAAFANQLLFAMCRDKDLVKSIREVTKEHPIFDVTQGQLSTVNERNVATVAFHICHFIDPSILCIVPIQIMVLFMTYYFGYTDNLKAYVHYDFRKYINLDAIVPRPFVATEDKVEAPNFLNDRTMSFRCDKAGSSILNYKNIYSHEYLGNKFSKLQNDCWYDFVYVHPLTLLINIVTGCCNYYYFNYGWDYTRPSMELLLSYYMEEPDMDNTLNYIVDSKVWEARKKLGLSGKEPKPSRKREPIPEEFAFMKPELIISCADNMLHIPRRFVDRCFDLFRSFNELVRCYRTYADYLLFDHMIVRDPREVHQFFIAELYSTTMRPQRSSYDISIYTLMPNSIYGRLHSGYDYGFLTTILRDHAYMNPLEDMMLTYAKQRKARGLKHAITWPD